MSFQSYAVGVVGVLGYPFQKLAVSLVMPRSVGVGWRWGEVTVTSIVLFLIQGKKNRSVRGLFWCNEYV